MKRLLESIKKSLFQILFLLALSIVVIPDLTLKVLQYLSMAFLMVVLFAPFVVMYLYWLESLKKKKESKNGLLDK